VRLGQNGLHTNPEDCTADVILHLHPAAVPRTCNVDKKLEKRGNSTEARSVTRAKRVEHIIWNSMVNDRLDSKRPLRPTIMAQPKNFT